MLKEVGASGQISLGKKYAGQLFDVVFAPDGRVELVPMKAVPTVLRSATGATTYFEYPEFAPSTQNTLQEANDIYQVGDGWLTPARLAARKAAYERTLEEIDAARGKWEKENKDAIEAMNERVAKIGSMGSRIHEWRKAKSLALPLVKAHDAAKAGNGAV